VTYVTGQNFCHLIVHACHIHTDADLPVMSCQCAPTSQAENLHSIGTISPYFTQGRRKRRAVCSCSIDSPSIPGHQNAVSSSGDDPLISYYTRSFQSLYRRLEVAKPALIQGDRRQLLILQRFNTKFRTRRR
jgi:hypothetical protein